MLDNPIAAINRFAPMRRSALPIANAATPPKPAPLAGATRVFLIGNEPRGRASLRALLEQSGTAVVAAELPDVDDPAEANRGALPDVVVLDVPTGPQGESSLRRACERWNRVPVLAWVESADFERARALVLAGARGVLFRADTAQHLASAVQKVQEHELWLDRASVARLIEELSAEHARAVIVPRDPMSAKLTDREVDIVGLVAQGLCNKSIASRLEISDNTVRHHLTSIFGKLGVHDRLALAVHAFRNGVHPPS